MTLSAKCHAGRNGIDRFRTSGATKVVFPRRADAVEAIMLNTSGGLTGGDRFQADARAGPDSQLVLTTQAAERAYRSQSGTARIRTRLSAAEGATLHWLPQEMIVFDGAALDRRLDLDVAGGAEAVLVEPVIFGRRAMGETRVSGVFRDRITVTRGGTPLYCDRIDLSGLMSARLCRPAIARGLTALASALYIGPRAEALLRLVREILPRTGGASLVAPDFLTIRLLAEDSYLLRQTLVPVLECLTRSVLPKFWSL
ncbi:urease accessory protein [Cribrihabitans marinus]|uniref:Urease accessory protein UreD n=1 Tax=Cribrihabitans marinus TaxID=1227549 RepID=A0A1H7DEG3_9RHOB|nr:urease accessory protein UreD [Cribrihabitans marinus]GGH37929.1 urease accessory protein UreD [Cribrihabitans marinus]SEJ97600.1 urease accessory protein [Cribrihabitans marinus]